MCYNLYVIRSVGGCEIDIELKDTKEQNNNLISTGIVKPKVNKEWY